MYVYIQSDKAGSEYIAMTGERLVWGDLYTVGHYDPNGSWIPESDHNTTEEAAARVHYLNGGKGENDD
jgi:hypothetical protein